MDMETHNHIWSWSWSWSLLSGVEGSGAEVPGGRGRGSDIRWDESRRDATICYFADRTGQTGGQAGGRSVSRGRFATHFFEFVRQRQTDRQRERQCVCVCSFNTKACVYRYASIPYPSHVFNLKLPNRTASSWYVWSPTSLCSASAVQCSAVDSYYIR
ncbi:hypothetical protein BDV95DRAFT_243463 [Massariosphaeria phaeospora]|uniref:Uncharacterized protein n=1 Tax=Massariosphaeria phaeospora TaxID=100035 RepID=A0A7C8HZ87_9PLEO|nr:hypothetical protein BDV95DRAFT_243463 [Massariosphaeria phaeospora]